MEKLGLGYLPSNSLDRHERAIGLEQHGLFGEHEHRSKGRAAVWRKSFQPQQTVDVPETKERKRQLSQRSRQSRGSTKKNLYKEICTTVNAYNKRHKGKRFPVSLPSKSDLVFSGVVSVLYNEAADGILRRKSLHIDSVTTVRSLINQCLVKFGLTGESTDFALHEINHREKSSRMLPENDRPLMLMVYSEEDSKGTFYCLQEKRNEPAEERWARGNVRQRDTRVLQLEKQRSEIIAKLKPIKPVGSVEDHGLVEMELQFDDSLYRIRRCARDADYSLQSLVKGLGECKQWMMGNVVAPFGVWETLRPHATQVVYHVRQLVTDSHEIVLQHCLSGSCGLLTTQHLNLVADTAKELVQACQHFGRTVEEEDIACQETISELLEKIDVLTTLLKQCSQAVQAACLTSQLLQSAAPWPPGRIPQMDSRYDTPAEVSGAILYSAAVALSRLIQAGFDRRQKDISDMAADLAQPTQLLLQLLNASPDYASLEGHPLKVRIKWLEEELKNDMSELFKLSRAAADSMATTGSVSSMLLAGFVVISDSSRLLIAAQCASLLNKTTITGWSLLRMSWFSNWLEEQRTLQSEASNSTLPPHPLSSVTGSMPVMSSFHASAVGWSPSQSESDSDQPSMNRRTRPRSARQVIGHDFRDGPAHDHNELFKTSSATQLRPSIRVRAPSQEKSTLSTMLSSLRVSDPALGLQRHHHNHSDGPATLQSQQGLSQSFGSISNISDRSVAMLPRQRRGSFEWTDMFGNNRLKPAVSNDSILAHHSAISEGLISNLTASRASLLASDSEEVPGQHGFASLKKNRSCQHLMKMDEQSKASDQLDTVRSVVIANAAIGKVLEGLNFSVTQKAAWIQSQVKGGENSTNVMDVTRLLVRTAEQMADEVGAMDVSVIAVSEDQEGSMSRLTLPQYNEPIFVSCRLLSAVTHEHLLTNQSFLDNLKQLKDATLQLVTAALKVVSAGRAILQKLEEAAHSPSSSKMKRGNHKSIYQFAEEKEDEHFVFEEKPGQSAPGKDVRRVRAGTVGRLVQRLTYHKVADVEFSEVFLATFHLFLTSEEFLEALVARYHMKWPSELSSADVLGFQQDVLVPTQLRVCSVLRQWISSYGEDFEDNGLISKLSDFIKVVHTSYPSCGKQLISLLKKKQEKPSSCSAENTLGALRDGLTKEGKHSEEMPRDEAWKDLLGLAPAAFASQLTVYLGRLFHSVTVRDWLSCLDESTNSRRVHLLHEHKRKFKEWLCCDLLSNGLDKTAIDNHLTYCVRLVKHLVELKNFDSAQTLVEVLTDDCRGAVTEALESISGGVWSEWDHLRKTVLAQRSAGEFSTGMDSSGSCLPIISTVLSGLRIIDQEQPSMLAESLVNINKYRQLFYYTHRLCQHRAHHDIVSDNAVQALLQQVFEAKTTSTPPEIAQ